MKVHYIYNISNKSMLYTHILVHIYRKNSKFYGRVEWLSENVDTVYCLLSEFAI